MPCTGFIKIDGSLYYFSTKTGAAPTKDGWKTIGGKKYYIFRNGYVPTGIIAIKGNYYEFSSKGALIRKLKF